MTAYNKDSVRKYVREEVFRVSGALVERIEIHGFAINFGGGWFTSTQKLFSTLGLGNSL